MTEFRARLRPKPGSIMPNGAIVTAPRSGPGSAFQGTVWIEQRRLAVAQTFGWEPDPNHSSSAPAGLVAVKR